MRSHNGVVVRQHGVAVLLAAGGLLAVLAATTEGPEAVPPPVLGEAPPAATASRDEPSARPGLGGPDLAATPALELFARAGPRREAARLALASTVPGDVADAPAEAGAGVPARVDDGGGASAGRRDPLAGDGDGMNDDDDAGGEAVAGAEDDGDEEDAGEFHAGWVWPARGQVTSEFGERWGRLHKGLDVNGRVGTAVVAAARGEVTAAQSKGGYGLRVTVDHGAGIETAYAHLAAVEVTAGEWVEAGDPLGAIGCTGSCTGPHLHFEVRRDGAAVNPREVLP